MIASGCGSDYADRMNRRHFQVAVTWLAAGAAGYLISENAAADNTPPEDRVNVTTELVRGEDVFAWITIPDGNDRYRCLLLANEIDNGSGASDAVAALWCTEIQR